MIRDRMAELKAGSAKMQKQEFTTLKMEPNFTDTCQQQFDKIGEMLETLSRQVEDVKKKHATILLNPLIDNKIKLELDTLNENVKSSSSTIRTELKILSQKIESESKKVVNAETRIKQAQLRMLSTKFIEILNGFNIVQNEYRSRCKVRIVRQLEITGKSFNDDQLENLLENPNPQIFAENIIADTQQAKAALVEIDARHEEILKLENSIRELNEMFLDISLLVAQQGDQVENIRINVEKAHEYVETGKVELVTAKRNKSKSRKKKFIIAIVVVVVVAIIVTVIACSV